MTAWIRTSSLITESVTANSGSIFELMVSNMSKGKTTAHRWHVFVQQFRPPSAIPVSAVDGAIPEQGRTQRHRRSKAVVTFPLRVTAGGLIDPPTIQAVTRVSVSPGETLTSQSCFRTASPFPTGPLFYSIRLVKKTSSKNGLDVSPVLRRLKAFKKLERRRGGGGLS